MSYFLLYGYSKSKIEVELELSNYATKSDLKNAATFDTSQFPIKNEMNLNSEVDKLDIDKLEKLDIDKMTPALTDLRKLSSVVKMMLLKKMFMMLKSKILKIKYLVLLT